MLINKLQNNNNFINFNSSYEYREKRAAFIREKIDEYDSNSIMSKTSEGFIGVGLVLLAFEKLNSSFKDLKKSEQLGFLAFIAGAVMQFTLMFKHCDLSIKLMKQYNQKHNEENLL